MEEEDMTGKELMLPNLEEVKALQIVSAMDKMLEQAEDWDAILNVRNGSLGIATLAGAMKMGKVAQKAKIVQLKAERKAGGWLELQPEFGHGGGNRVPGTQGAPGVTLGALGISKKQSSAWQMMAKMPDRQFSQWVEDCLGDDEEITRSGLLRYIDTLGTKTNRVKRVGLELILATIDRMVEQIEWYIQYKEDLSDVLDLQKGVRSIRSKLLKIANGLEKADTKLDRLAQRKAPK